MNDLSTLGMPPLEIAQQMAFNELLPEHLRGKKAKNGKWEGFHEKQRVAIAVSIVNAAQLWGCNPFMLAEQSYMVHGKMDYSGAFYAALANTRGNLSEPLRYEFSGKGDARTVTVTGRFAGTNEEKSVTWDVKRGLAQGNAATWKDDPDQMLCYSGARRWVRRHCPQVLLGMVPPELEDVVPEEPSEPMERIVEAAVPFDYASAINMARTQDELKDIASRIDSDESLSNDARQLYLQMGRDRYKALIPREKPVQQVLAEASTSDEPSEAYMRWERTLQTTHDVEQIIRDRHEIETDDGLAGDERALLLSIADNLLSKEKQDT